jgi:hypothetical protein
MNRRKFIALSGGTLVSVGSLQQNGTRTSLAITNDDFNLPTESSYTFTSSGSMFKALQLDITNFTIETSNLEAPKNTSIEVSAETEKQDKAATINPDVLEYNTKSSIPRTGIIDITNKQNIQFDLMASGGLTNEDFNVPSSEGERTTDVTDVTVTFNVKNVDDNIDLSASETFSVALTLVQLLEDIFSGVRILDSSEALSVGEGILDYRVV